jgi:hypothetical protein
MLLHKMTISKDVLEQTINEKGMFPNRGPETFYRLKEVDSSNTAQVRR